MNFNSNNLEYLAAQASRGNEACFVELCEILKMSLFRTAIGILGSESLALEAVSETVFRALKGIRNLREPKYVKTWFTRIVLNVSNDMYRRQKRETALDAVPEGTYSDNVSAMEFRELVGELPSGLREIVSLKYYSDHTLHEISGILKIPEGTVKSRLNKALKLLRLELEVTD